MILARLRFKEASSVPYEVGFVPIECCLEDEAPDEPPSFDLLEAEYFDDEFIVIIYRLRSKDSS